jgi:hypothetical protein
MNSCEWSGARADCAINFFFPLPRRSPSLVLQRARFLRAQPTVTQPIHFPHFQNFNTLYDVAVFLLVKLTDSRLRTLSTGVGERERWGRGAREGGKKGRA